MAPMIRKLPLVAVVDDEPSICRALLRLLRSANFDAHSYASALEFLASLQHRMPDCIVVDLQMPGVNGFELQRRLKVFEQRPPVIVITAFDEPGVREQCLELGAMCYLRKPVEGATLLDFVRRAVSADVPS